MKVQNSQNKNQKGSLKYKVGSAIAVLSLSATLFAGIGENQNAYADTQKNFSDISTSFWAIDEINYLTGKGIINGYPNGEFGVKDSITRLQAVTMILREKGITDYSNVKNPGFVDVQPTNSGYDIIAKGVELGIINGKVNSNGEKIFDPSGKLTRAEMAKIIVNAYHLEGSDNVAYSDVPSTHWAYNAIHTLSQNKITTGIGNGKFGTNNSITRTEFAVMMARMLDESFAPTTSPTVSNNTDNGGNKTTTPTAPTVTGKIYPDGWEAPVLKSSWSPNHAQNLDTLENELGFTNGGTSYSLPDYPDALKIIESPDSKKYEFSLMINLWERTGKYPDSYRVPVVAKELLKLYFGDDATQVWNSINKHVIYETFTANNRFVNVRMISSVGDYFTEGIVFDVSYKK